MNSEDYENPELEGQWLSEQRSNVERYLRVEGVQHGGVASRPVWFIAPYVSIWTIQSSKTRSQIGWWAISGDLPTDYLSGEFAADARTAVAAFAGRWREVLNCMLRGETHPTMVIGRGENQTELGHLLKTRTAILEQWAKDDGLWA